MQFSEGSLIDASPERVFAALADPEGWPRRIPSITRVEVVGHEPVGIGTQFRETRIMNGKAETLTMTISEMVPPEHLVFTAHAHGSDLVASHHLQAQEQGTMLHVSMEMTPRTLLARLAMALSFVLAPLIRKQLRDDLTALKASIESEARAADMGTA